MRLFDFIDYIGRWDRKKTIFMYRLTTTYGPYYSFNNYRFSSFNNFTYFEIKAYTPRPRVYMIVEWL